MYSTTSSQELVWNAFQDRIGIWKCWFLRRGENQSTQRKISQSRVENQQQPQPTYDTGSRNRTRATLVEGEHSHHCAIPAPPIFIWLKHSQVFHSQYHFIVRVLVLFLRYHWQWNVPKLIRDQYKRNTFFLLPVHNKATKHAWIFLIFEKN